MEKDKKTWQNAEKIILTSKWHAKYRFAGQNTQQIVYEMIEKKSLI